MKFKEVRPELVYFLIDPSDAERTCDSTSSRRVRVRCPKCGGINQKVMSTFRNSGLTEKNCIHCNSFKTHFPELLIYLENEKDGELPKLSNKRISAICPKCKQRKEMPLSDLSRKSFSCSNCNSFRENYPELMMYLVNKEDGELRKTSHKIVRQKCPRCNKEKNGQMSILAINGFFCSECSDGISVPEKFMINILNQLGIEFKKEYSIDWSCGRRYDFFLPSLNTIIETHGKQHYAETGRGRTLKEEQKNDALKMKMAKNNNIEKYFIIDCRIVEKDFIEENIKKELFNALEIDRVDFNLAWEKSQLSIVPTVVEEYQKRILTNIEIADKYNISESTVTKYVSKMGVDLKLKKINPQETYNLYLEKKNKAEVARILGINVSTVYKHIKRIEKN